MKDMEGCVYCRFIAGLDEVEFVFGVFGAFEVFEAFQGFVDTVLLEGFVVFVSPCCHFLFRNIVDA